MISSLPDNWLQKYSFMNWEIRSNKSMNYVKNYQLLIMSFQRFILILFWIELNLKTSDKFYVP